MKQFIEQQMAQRATAWEAAKKILDVAAAEKRDLSAEETQSYERITKELEDRQATIEKLRADEARELRLDAATREFADQVRPVADAPRGVRSDAEVIRSMAKAHLILLIVQTKGSITPKTTAAIRLEQILTNFHNWLEIFKTMVHKIRRR